jgi:hypothetical protein
MTAHTSTRSMERLLHKNASDRLCLGRIWDFGYGIELFQARTRTNQMIGPNMTRHETFG